jgi:2',3'-cyclic-nucleotide 2'-phosphodiesterase (5'-nucleotidase family)
MKPGLRIRLLLAMLPLMLAATSCLAREVSITILYTGDTHGHIIPFSYPDVKTPGQFYSDMKYITDIGGIARRATLASRIRKEVHDDMLFVDAGDVMDGTPFSVEYSGSADILAMNAAGYDIMTVGNHEFNTSKAIFTRNCALPTFPVVCANVVDRSTGKLALPANKIFDVDGVKIAVFGLTIPSPTYPAAKEGYDYLDPIATAKQQAADLRKKADIVIALTHLGIESDKKLADAVPDIDVIIGGHSHTRIPVPIIIKHLNDSRASGIGGAIVVHDYQWAGELGRLDLKVDGERGHFALESYKGTLIPVTSDIPEDPVTAKVVDRFYAPIKSKYEAKLGTATEAFLNNDKGDNPIMNLVCDGFREAAHTDLAFNNYGGTRADILKGSVIMWDLASVLPFDNKLFEFKVTGKNLKALLARIRPGVSGARYKVENRTLIEATIAGKPIDDDATYTGITTDYLLNIMTRYVTDVKPSKVAYRDSVADYIKSKGTISPALDGRREVNTSSFE